MASFGGQVNKFLYSLIVLANHVHFIKVPFFMNICQAHIGTSSRDWKISLRLKVEFGRNESSFHIMAAEVVKEVASRSKVFLAVDDQWSLTMETTTYIVARNEQRLRNICKVAVRNRMGLFWDGWRSTICSSVEQWTGLCGHLEPSLPSRKWKLFHFTAYTRWADCGAGRWGVVLCHVMSLSLLTSFYMLKECKTQGK